MLLFEDIAGTAASKTRKFIKRRFGSKFDLNDIAKDDVGKPILTARGDTQTILNYLERQVRDVFFHNDFANIKFEPGVARIAFDNLNFQQVNQDAHGIENMKNILKILCAAHSDEYNSDLNGLTYSELFNRFNTAIKQYLQNEYDKTNSTNYIVNSDYTIVHIPDFKTAKKYYLYTNPNSRWCITYMKNMWMTYSAYNKNKVYFVLKNGFEKLKPIKSENCPLDEYGLSMFCVIVTNDAEDPNKPAICSCTCRWNHDNGGSDRIMNIEQISNVIGKSFFIAFKPYTKDELHAKNISTIEEIVSEYEETYDTDLFDHVYDDDRNDEDESNDSPYRVKLQNKYNYISYFDKNIICENWFDEASEFGYNSYRKLALVKLHDKYNFIDRDGEFISETWFDFASNFDDDHYARVRIRDKANFIDTNGSFLSDMWFDDVAAFSDKLARVENENGKFNYIDTDGKLISDTWFDFASEQTCGYRARIELNKKINFINARTGKVLSNIWFDDAKDFVSMSYPVLVKLNNKWNYLKSDGSLLSNTWYDIAKSFSYGFAVVCLNDKWNFIKTDGTALSDTWFDYIYKSFNACYDYATIQYKGKRASINSYGSIYVEGKLVNKASKEVTEHFKKYMQKYFND